MKAKKLLAALGVLVMAVPGVAIATHETAVVSEIVDGHTVFAAVLQETRTDFAAIAGIAAKRTTIGGVLWFNDQELIPASVASEIAAGSFVIATEAGDDPPSEHMDSAYLESYQFEDPNNRVWVVDRYTYDVCSAESGGQFHVVPCEGQSANQGVDADEDGHPELTTGENVVRQTKSLFVAEIGATALDAAASCGSATGKSYNFVLLVRMDALGAVAQDGKSHPSADDDALRGDHDNALAPPGSHTHDTAQLDLWFSETQRPPVPATRVLMFPEDTLGDTAPCRA